MRWVFALLALCGPAAAESLVATRSLPAQTIITTADVVLVEADLPQALDNAHDAIGLETRLTIHAGRPIRARDLTPPTLVERNALVILVYAKGGLTIRAEGRSLARGASGEVIRVMNLASKTTVSGRIAADGMVYVGG